MPNIHHNLLIASPLEKIYNAITTQDGLSAWWTSNTKASPLHNSIARFEFGGGYFKEMKITELSPPHKVKWLCITGAEEWIGTTISFELEPADKETHPELSDQIQQNGNNGTALILYHDNWQAYTPMFAECNYTWAQFMRSLKLFCETGTGRPWPNQHRI